MEESNEKQGGNSGDVFKSPNIRSAEGEELNMPSNLDGAETKAPAVDGIPIAEENIEFHAKDIQQHDDSKLFIKVEGAEKRAREAERDKKKKDEDLIKRLHSAANDRKKAHRKARNEKRIAKLKATHQAIHHKVKKTAKHIHRFRFVFLAIAVIIAGIIITFNVIIPKINEYQAEQKRAKEDEIVAQNKTEMINFFVEIIGKEIEISELEKAAQSANPDMFITAYETDGKVRGKGGDEVIHFAITKKDGKAIASKFIYAASTGGQGISIAGSEGYYYYECGDDLKIAADINELIREYILFRTEHGEE